MTGFVNRIAALDLRVKVRIGPLADIKPFG